MKKWILFGLVLLACFTPLYLLAANAPAKPLPNPKKQDLQHFDAINLSGVGNLYIKQTDEESFTLEADETLIPLIKVSVKDKTLYIDLKDASSHLKSKISYYLNIKTVNNITASGLTNVFIKNGLKTDALKFSISGLGSDADININVKQLTAKIEGGAKLTGRGVASTQVVSVKGAGEFDGTKLVGDTATLDINGTSVAKTNISNQLAVNISDDGQVQYCAQPNITQKIEDNGKISRLESGC
jgi:hypothetical protein